MKDLVLANREGTHWGTGLEVTIGHGEEGLFLGINGDDGLGGSGDDGGGIVNVEWERNVLVDA